MHWQLLPPCISASIGCIPPKAGSLNLSSCAPEGLAACSATLNRAPELVTLSNVTLGLCPHQCRALSQNPICLPHLPHTPLLFLLPSFQQESNHTLHASMCNKILTAISSKEKKLQGKRSIFKPERKGRSGKEVSAREMMRSIHSFPSLLDYRSPFVL